MAWLSSLVPWQLVDGDALRCGLGSAACAQGERRDACDVSACSSCRSAWVRNVQSRDELDWMNVRLIIRRLPCILTVTPATLAAASRAVSQMPAAKEVGFDLRQVRWENINRQLIMQQPSSMAAGVSRACRSLP